MSDVGPKSIVVCRLPNLQLGRVEELFPGDSDGRWGPENMCHRVSMVGSLGGGAEVGSGDGWLSTVGRDCQRG